MNKETIETAAFGYVKDKYIPLEKAYGSKEEMGSVKAGFIAGATWQEQQEANNAIEFADWLCENGWSSSPPMWVNGEASDDYLGGQGTYTELTTQQLYEIWQEAKNK
jgi:hypothetical protein